MSKQFCNFIIVLFTIGFGVNSAQSQELGVEDIINQLQPQPLTRSYDPNRGVTVEGGQQQDDRPTLNLYINFDYDSAALKQDSLIVLDRLALALEDNRLSRFEFLIGGHTDAAGSDIYNQDLSERRATAVREYLRQRHAITPDRLIATGFGETRLLDPTLPLDSVNRRVQITNISIPTQ